MTSGIVAYVQHVWNHIEFNIGFTSHATFVGLVYYGRVIWRPVEILGDGE